MPKCHSSTSVKNTVLKKYRAGDWPGDAAVPSRSSVLRGQVSEVCKLGTATTVHPHSPASGQVAAKKSGSSSPQQEMSDPRVTSDFMAMLQLEEISCPCLIPVPEWTFPASSQSVGSISSAEYQPCLGRKGLTSLSFNLPQVERVIQGQENWSVPCGFTDRRRNGWKLAQISAERMPEVSRSTLDVNKSSEGDGPHSSPLNLARKWRKQLDIHRNSWATSKVGSQRTCHPFYLKA